MPDKIIQVDGLGQVAFPDTMSNDDIGKAIQTHLAKQGPKAAPAPASALDNLQGLASHAWSATSNAASSLAGKAADALGVKGESASDVVGDLFSSVLGGAPNTKNDRDQQQQDMRDQAKQAGPSGDLARNVLQANAAAKQSVIPQSVQDYAAGVSQHASTLVSNPKLLRSLQGIDAAGGKAALAATSPEAITALGAAAMNPVAAALGGLYFAPDIAKGAYQGAKDAYHGYQTGDYRQMAEGATSALINAATGGMMLDHFGSSAAEEAVHPLDADPTGQAPAMPKPTAPPEAPAVPDAQGHFPFQQNMFGEGPTAPTAPEAGPVVPDHSAQSSFAYDQSSLFDSNPTHTPAHNVGQAAFGFPEDQFGNQGGPTAPTAPEQFPSPTVSAQPNLPFGDLPAVPEPPPAPDAPSPVPPPTEGLLAQNSAPEAAKEGNETPAPEPQNPHTEAPQAASVDPATPLGDSIRQGVGSLLNLSRLVKGNQIHGALDRGIQATRELLGTEGTDQHVLSQADQKLLSIVMGEPVRGAFTNDQMMKAIALKGKVMGDTPQLQYRPKASDASVAASRTAMEQEIATTTDTALKAKLQAALTKVDATGKPMRYLYKPGLVDKPNVPVDPDHAEAPFNTVQYGAEAPKISKRNLQDALPGETIRNNHLGLGDPNLINERQALVAQPTDESVTSAMGGEVGMDPATKNLTDEQKSLDDQIQEGGVRARMNQIAGDLRTKVRGFTSATNGSDPLIEQLKGLHPDTLGQLPQEIQRLVEPAKPEASETAPESTPKQGPSPTGKTSEAATPQAPSLRASKNFVEKTYLQIKNAMPQHLPSVQKLIQVAADHFDEDTDGAVHAAASALKIFKQGLKDGNDYAYRDAVKAIRRLQPRDLDQSVTFNSGLNPKIGVDASKKLLQYVSPKLTEADNTASSAFTFDARMSRYEKMTASNRSAFAKQIYSDENDRLAAEADPDGLDQAQQRLNDLRATVKPQDIQGYIKQFAQKSEQQILADQTRTNIRALNGKRAQFDVRLQTTLNKFSADVDKWSDFESRDFIDKMERGLTQSSDLKNDAAAAMRGVLDEARNRITAINGDFEEYLQNYFPHIWSNVGKGQELATQMGRMSGDESFTKSRELDTFNEGIRQGLQPVTQNPLKLTLMRAEQMHRYAMKEEIAHDMKASGAAQLIVPNSPVPAGLVPLNDPAFQRTGALQGSFYASKEVAKMFNNFTSKGLAGKWDVAGLSAYDMLRKTNNTMNMAELSASGLHGVFSSVNSIISEQARGLTKIVNGVMSKDGGQVAEGIGNFASSLNFIGRYKLGSNLIAHIKDPDAFANLSQLADAHARAGGRIGMDTELSTAFKQQMQTSWKRATDDSVSGLGRATAAGKTILNGMGRTMEVMMSPIMNHIVPNLKAGAFAKAAQDILANSADLKPEEIDAKLQQAYDNGEDRFGQLATENLFWDKTTKDLLTIAMRSPGWNIGTLRAGYGGVMDLAKSIKDLPRTKQFQITDRTAYLGALVGSTMVINGAANLIMTGQMPHGMDYFFARTGTNDENGEPNRIMPKLYTYDYIGFARHPETTLLHKMSPIIGTINDLHANKTFYGRSIYDEGDSAPKRMAQMIGYVAKQYVPFSIDNFQESQARGQGVVGSLLASAAGILPAPKDAGRSDAENLANTYFAKLQASGGVAQDLYDKKQSYAKYAIKIKNGEMSGDDIRKGIKDGKIPRDIMEHVYRQKTTAPLERWTNAIKSPADAMNIYQAGTTKERRQLLQIMMKRAETIDSPQERTAYIKGIREGLQSEPQNPHPDTHAFSVSSYQESNPSASPEDVSAAANEALANGYSVTHAQ